MKRILVLFVGAVYFLASTGVAVYKSNCTCTNNEQVTIYISPETCESDLQQHHRNTNNKEDSCCETKCHGCSDESAGCDCNIPESFFFKLKVPAANEEVLFVNVQPVVLHLALFSVLFEELHNTTFEVNPLQYIDPPPIPDSSLEFLVQIHQLKIPSVA